MATMNVGSTALSLEDELAEATQDLLTLGRHQDSHDTLHAQFSNVSSLKSPSPFSLNKATPDNGTRNNGKGSLNVDKALSIDANARLTPILDNGDAVHSRDTRESGKKNVISIVNNSIDATTAEEQLNDHFPAARLHETVRSVTLASGVARPHHNQSNSSTPSFTPSPGLLAAQKSLQSLPWHTERGQRADSSEKIGRQLDSLQNRLNLAARGGGEAEAEGSQEVRTPSFFLQSFPTYKEAKTPKAESRSSQLTAPVPVRSTSSVNVTPSKPGFPLHISSQAGVTATMTDASVTVKLHGNRRAEREAAIASTISNTRDTNDEGVGESSSSRLENAFSSSPINEIGPYPIYGGSMDDDDDDDANSLVSLPATTASTASSGTRRRPSIHRRRRSAGGHSYTTTGSEEGHRDRSTSSTQSSHGFPFARDVHIRGFSVVGEKARGYVAYDVRITTQTGSTMSILRRFSSFVTLRKALLKELSSENNRAIRGGSNSAILTTTPPPLPPKRSGLLQKYASDHLERRRKALQKWLAVVMLDKTMGTSRSLRRWVISNDFDHSLGHEHADDDVA